MTINTRSVTFAEAEALHAKGARWLCVAAYDHMGHEKGDVLSWHRTYNAAARAAGASQFRSIDELDYVETVDGPYYLAAQRTRQLVAS